MIGVVSHEDELTSVQEFFQLFKTPWEYYVPGNDYDIVVATREDFADDLRTNVLVLYSSNHTTVDADAGISIESRYQGGLLSWADADIPVYGGLAVLTPIGWPLLTHKQTGGTISADGQRSGLRMIRIGYDLFQEVSFLLSRGQPAEHAQIPTLELHIALLRSILLNAGISFLEIPPVPAGYQFMACLTHDVDFTGIREHKFDHTMWGFAYRALAGSLVGALRRKLSWSKCWKNWQAALSLPLVFLGLKEDFWLEFDRYMEIERDLGTTFFFIPYKDYPGSRGSHPAPKRRAAKYNFATMKEQVTALVKNGCEVGLHGIDAWQDVAKARAEANGIQKVIGETELGIRMHWLYFNEMSPKVLEEAGFCYDSTFGYNDAVGFRAGTAQAFRMAPAEFLLELPLTIQDTALFYPDRLNLSEPQAMELCRSVMQSTAKVGGVLTVNWHTRSLSPERLWDEFYSSLLAELRKYRVWFGTAKQVVSWFRKRRAIRFERVEVAGGGVRVKIIAPDLGGSPPFGIRVHHVKSHAAAAFSSMPLYSDMPWEGEVELTLDEYELG
jgi:hypothetical protein